MAGTSFFVAVCVLRQLLLVVHFAKDFLWLCGVATSVWEGRIDVCLFASFEQVVCFFHKRVEAVLALIGAVPPCVVRSHHHGAHACATAFVVPELIELHFKVFIKVCGLVEQTLFIELVEHGLGWLVVAFVVFFHGLVVVEVEVVDPRVTVALAADSFHLVALDFPACFGREGLEVFRPYGERSLGFPRDSFGDVVAGHDFARTRHMTCGTCRGTVINASGPCPGRRIPVVLVAKGVIDVAVFGFRKDFDLRMVRTEMALATGFRFTSFHNGKTVAGMAACAAPERTVEIHSANANVGPCCGINLAVFHFDNSTVAVVAACFAFVIRVHAFVQPRIKLPHNFNGVGVLGTAVLFYLVRMAARTVFRGDNACHGNTVFSFAPLII